MLRLFRERSGKKRGLPPGAPVYVGDETAREIRVEVIDYDGESLEEKSPATLEECFPLKATPTVSWINFDGIHKPEMISGIGNRFDLHPLTVEDILNTGGRPKLEDHGEHLFLMLKMLSRGADGEIQAEQVSLVLGRSFVLSFQERPGDVFDPVRERIRTGKGRIRSAGPDYLAYSLLDAVVDSYFSVLEGLGDRIEGLEEAVVDRPEPEVLRTIYGMKKELIYLRKSIWPLREAVAAMARDGSDLVTEATRTYLRDVYDHAVQVIEILEAYRDVIGGMVDTYLSSVSNRMNEVMKVLTVIATIFIPMTFIAGVYGMNFKLMPELSWPYGYPAAWALMLASAILVLAYLRRKKWL